VEMRNNVNIGRDTTVEALRAEYDAVILAAGAWNSSKMRVEGEEHPAVVGCIDFLRTVALGAPMDIGKNVAVVGGGNVAMDAARCAKRLGAEVYIVYRRSEKELPARAEEVEHAKDEGIIFKTLTNPISVLGYHNPDNSRDPRNGSVQGIRCVEMELGEPDESGRRRPIVKQNSQFDIELDCVIMALGTSPNPLIKSTTQGLDTEKWGGIIANEDGLTSRDGVYAGGDAVTGAATVILAMGAGKNAAQAIDKALAEKD